MLPLTPAVLPKAYSSPRLVLEGNLASFPPHPQFHPTPRHGKIYKATSCGIGCHLDFPFSTPHSLPGTHSFHYTLLDNPEKAAAMATLRLLVSSVSTRVVRRETS